jgi:hypothetical protein
MPTFIPNKFIMKIYSTIYLIILIMYYKYIYIYNCSKLEKTDFSRSENNFYLRTDEYSVRGYAGLKTNRSELVAAAKY